MGSDDKPIGNGNQVGTDLMGFGALAQYLAGPIFSGVGAVFKPVQMKRENRAQLAMLDEWSEALKEKGLEMHSADLTIGQRAEIRVMAENIRHQRNREAVGTATVEQARLEQVPQKNVPPPSPDWLNQFWRLAENVTDEDMQAFWGTILARTCLGHASVSPRTLQIISTLSSAEAAALERAAAFYITVESKDGHIQHAIFDKISGNSGEFGKDVKSVNEKLVFVTVGLTKLPDGRVIQTEGIEKTLFGSLGIFVESGWAYPIVQAPSNNQIRFTLGGIDYIATSREPIKTEHGLHNFGGSIEVSPMGAEIFQFIRPALNPAYIVLIKEGFAIKGFDLIEV